MLGSVLRPLRSAGYWIESALASAFQRLSHLFKGKSRAGGVEAAVERVAVSLAGRSQESSRFGSALEAGAGAVLRAITRWKLNYLFAAFFAGAIGYELYLISIASTPTGRDNLLATLRLTIYFAIVFFSLAHFAQSPARPWRAVWDGWAGVYGRIRMLPGAFVACLSVYLAARALAYVPATFVVGREAYVAVGNFALGLVFYFCLSLVTARIYWRTIREPSQSAPMFSMTRLLLTTTAMWVATACVKTVLTSMTGLTPPRFLIIVFQLSWLGLMLWTAITLFVVPATVSGVPRPLRTGLSAAWSMWWALVVSLILVNFPADLFQVAISFASPGVPSRLPVRLGIDIVSAIVNAVVYFASQATVLLLFTSAMRLRARELEPNL